MPSGDTPDLNLLFPQRTAAAEQKLFGRYTLKRVLGRGGMGIVWMAHDDELHRYVAMKFLPDMLIRDREAVNDLKRETRRSLDLTHHHIVRIYDFTQDDVCAAIIMEYVDGETLSAMKTQQSGGCFSVSAIAAWVAHFCQALDYAHRQARVVHRDLKPANLMVNSRGDLKVTDFGISRSMSDSMTRVSMSNTAGTLAYMSPEQALGAPPAACDDVYAFGATIYDMLTGRPPFFRGNIQVQLETVIPPKMAERRDELGNQGEPISDLWEQVIARCLAKRPNDRPQSMGEIATMLGFGTSATTLRTSFSPGTASGTGTGGPGTAATRPRTPTVEDSATRTDTLPPTPQTTRPATAGTRGTPYVSTPRPTALRDVIPGYIEEPAEPPGGTAPAAQTPATTPTQAKVEVPSSREVQAPFESESAPEPAIAEVAAQIEPAVEPSPDILPAQESELIEGVEPMGAISEPVAPEIFADVAENIDVMEAPVVAEELPAKEFVAEAEPVLEFVAPAAPLEPDPAAAVPEVEEEELSSFPTLIGEPLVAPESPEAFPTEGVQIIDSNPADVADSSPIADAEPSASVPDQLVAEEPPLLDEAAAPLVEASTPEPSQPLPVTSAPPPPARLPTLVRDSGSPPARKQTVPWLPVAGAAGIIAVIGIWLGMPKDKGTHEEPGAKGTTPHPAEPTPVPIVPESETKLQRARALYSNQEFPEAIALLKAVQQLDPKNEDAANLLAEIDKISREKQAMAKRQEEISGLLAKADAAMNRESWKEMRDALEEVLKLDPQNAPAISQLSNLADAEKEWARAEKERENELLAEEKERERQRIAAMQAEQRQREADKERARQMEQERQRNTAEDESPRKKPKATPRQRARTEEDSNDRPPKRVAPSREDQRPPAPTRQQPQPSARSTPAPAPQSPKPPPNVFRGGPPGG